ncbi:PTS sugar transporter subunit IIA [Candidatus Enterococcus courvalinii]|uniref:Mannitol-specific phosphotransferase enzyme IIA component n=1 Tax=Candidatus Enterococcus courvalinii TaxID=2815329 RepID=A0ABS3HZ36_9ENTE|nr:PTS sugar transporter subunit IIA [Enterococcus sp. MSG2901]MBO0481717.1 PTS sugar transporter subunit IIA [Enterococcus sp. MSG2901]
MKLATERIRLNQSFSNWQDALINIGSWLTNQGWVKEGYTESMIKRQELMSVYIGNFVALPHGDEELVVKEGISLIQVPDGVNFGTEEEPKIATILFAVTFKKEQQLPMLQELAFFCAEIEQVIALSDAKTVSEVQAILEKNITELD